LTQRGRHGALDRGQQPGRAVADDQQRASQAPLTQIGEEPLPSVCGLGQSGEHVEGELAARGGGVDRLLEAAEPDPALGQARDGVDQMAQGTAQPVQFSKRPGVARAELVQELREGGTVAAGARWRSQ
jgi:hypothetical protein